MMRSGAYSLLQNAFSAGKDCSSAPNKSATVQLGSKRRIASGTTFEIIAAYGRTTSPYKFAFDSHAVQRCALHGAGQRAR
jgi:hypothetical protein